MNVVVLVKQTFDTEAKVDLDSNGLVSAEGVNLVLDPYSEFAVEEGIRIKERLGGEVTILCVGPDSAQTAVRQAFAMGADKGVLVKDDRLSGGDASSTSKVLAAALGKIPHDIILAGFKSVDNGTAQVVPRVAELLSVPHVHVVTKIDLDGGKAVVTKEIDDGVEIIEVPLPAIFSAQQGLAEPRYPSMKGIMAAKKKPLEFWSLDDVNVDPAAVGSAGSKTRVIKYTMPVARKAGRVIEADVV
ncbi:MAG TPA: electron transfer flavoprotein subunit beta/FixA family protein, partial [Desulfobacteria bacterium]|nr:electron transfer flavoprotein subunit beta/FixA family protein [Desulfobacteria bacterium]